MASLSDINLSNLSTETGLPKPESTASVGPFGGELEQLSPSLTMEWLNDDAIQYVMFADLNRDTIDALIANQDHLMSRIKSDFPIFTVLDSAQAKAGLSVSNASYAVKQMQSGGGKPFPKQAVWMAFVLSRSVTAQVINLALRTASGLNKNIHVQVFYSSSDALRWLRFHLAKATSPANVQAGQADSITV